MAAVAAACASPAAAGTSYFYRSKPAVIAPIGDNVPEAFSFAALTEVAPATQVTSERIRLTGHTGVTASLSGEPSAQFRICSDAACATATPWGSTSVAVPGAATGDSWAELRMTSGAVASAARVATFSAGDASSNWSVRAKVSNAVTTTVGLPSGWELEYVPASATISNAHVANTPNFPARIRDGDLVNTAWSYPTDQNQLTVAQYYFGSGVDVRPDKCFLAWRNATSTTVTIRLSFQDVNYSVSSKPGVNIYNGPCGTPAAIASGSAFASMLDMAGTGINLLEFKVGK
jgi:hypothetical protein